MFLRNDRIPTSNSGINSYYGTLPSSAQLSSGKWFFWWDLIIANDGTVVSMFTSLECELEQTSDYANGGVNAGCAEKFRQAMANAPPMPPDAVRLTYTRCRCLPTPPCLVHSPTPSPHRGAAVPSPCCCCCLPSLQRCVYSFSTFIYGYDCISI